MECQKNSFYTHRISRGWVYAKQFWFPEKVFSGETYQGFYVEVKKDFQGAKMADKKQQNDFEWGCGDQSLVVF